MKWRGHQTPSQFQKKTRCPAVNRHTWLSDHVDVVRLCLRTAATNGPIIHPPGDMWAWRAVVTLKPAGVTPDSSTRTIWQSYQQRHLGASRRNGKRSENFACQYLKYIKGSLTCGKILRRGASGFRRTSHSKEGLLRIFIAHKNSLLRPGMNPWPLGPVANTLTTTSTTRVWTNFQTSRTFAHNLNYRFRPCNVEFLLVSDS
jgi:hypothetical protein